MDCRVKPGNDDAEIVIGGAAFSLPLALVGDGGERSELDEESCGLVGGNGMRVGRY